MTEILILTPKIMEDRHEVLVPLFSRLAEANSDYTSEWLAGAVMNGSYTGWLIDNVALAMTKIDRRPLRSVVSIDWLVGKSSDGWMGDFLEYIHRYAKINQCDAVVFEGRRGYGRKFPNIKQKLGYKELRTVYRAEIA